MTKPFGRAGWGSYTMVCFYCKSPVLAPLPTKCWHCGCTLSKPIVPEMKVAELADLCFNNKRRLVFRAQQSEKERV